MPHNLGDVVSIDGEGQRHRLWPRTNPHRHPSDGNSAKDSLDYSCNFMVSCPRKILSSKESTNVSLHSFSADKNRDSKNSSDDQAFEACRDVTGVKGAFLDCRHLPPPHSLPLSEETSPPMQRTNCLFEELLPASTSEEQGNAEQSLWFDDMCPDGRGRETSRLSPKRRKKQKKRQQQQRQILKEGEKEQEAYCSLKAVLPNETPFEKSEDFTPPTRLPVPHSALLESPAISSPVCMSTCLKEGEDERGEGSVCSLYKYQPPPPPQQQQQQHEEYFPTSLTVQKCKRFLKVRGSCSNVEPDTLLHYDHHSRQRYSFTPEVNPALCRLVEEHVLASLIQHVEKLMPHRQAELRRVAQYLTSAIGHVAASKGVYYGDLRYYLFGSVAMCTVLPDGDNDMTIDIDRLLCPTKIGAQGEILADSKVSAHSNTNSGSNSDVLSSQAAVTAGAEFLSALAEHLRQNDKFLYVDAFVLAEVCVLKLVKDESCYDITVGQFGGVDCVRFLQELDMEIGCNHLLKRTLLLLRAWCSYEAHVLSGQGGYISSYAATIMLIAMINTVQFLEDVNEGTEEGEKKEEERMDEKGSGCHFQEEFKDVSPLRLFARFLKFFRYFDFERYCVTVFGPLPCSSLTGKSLDLSRLEVPAAHKAVYGEFSKPSGMRLGEEEDVDRTIDVNVLGLTPEGDAVLGHCIRRRAKPLVTVSGVKHLLHDEHLRRQRGRTSLSEVNQEVEEVGLGKSAVGNNAQDRGRPRLNRSGCVEEDMSLLCFSCDTSTYSLRTLNVMDPLRWGTSLCRGVCRNHLQRIRRAFREGLALFEMASAKLMSETSPSCVSNGGSDVAISALPRMCHTMGAVSSSVNGNAGDLASLSSIKRGILQDLFGQTLKVLERHSLVRRRPSPPLQLAHCGKCSEPSFFCVSDPRRVCEPRFTFDLVEEVRNDGNEPSGDRPRVRGPPDGLQSFSFVPASMQQPQPQHHQQHHHPHHQQHHQPQHQQQQQQLSMMRGSLSMTSPPMSSIASAGSPNTDSLQFMDFFYGGSSWLGMNSNNTHRDSSMSVMSLLVLQRHPARGAPLLRTSTKNAGGLRGKRAVPSTAPANKKPFSFVEPGGPLSPHSGHSRSGTASTNCRVSIERGELDGASANFTPPSASSLTDARLHDSFGSNSVPQASGFCNKSKTGVLNAMSVGNTMALSQKSMMRDSATLS